MSEKNKVELTVTSITASFERNVNLGNYEMVKFGLTQTAELSEPVVSGSSEWRSAVRKLQSHTVRMVDDAIKVEGYGDDEDE